MKKTQVTVAVVILAMAAAAALTWLSRVDPAIAPVSPAPGAEAAPGAGAQVPSPAPPEQPDLGTEIFAGRRVLLLGDSLASGEGAGTYLNGSDEPHQRCHRSAAGWFAGTRAMVTNMACSRAVIRNLTEPQSHPEYNRRPEPAQLGAASSAAADAALVMLGGNDVRFAEIFNACVLSNDDCASDPVFTSEALRSAGNLSASLAGAYRRVADRFDDKVVLVPAYPNVFGELAGDCGRISPEEASFARALTVSLNSSIRTAAGEAALTHPSVHYVEATEEALAGHGACDPAPYVHTVLPTALIGAAQEHGGAQELLHPNAAGYAQLTRTLSKWVSNNPSVNLNHKN